MNKSSGVERCNARVCKQFTQYEVEGHIDEIYGHNIVLERLLRLIVQRFFCEQHTVASTAALKTLVNMPVLTEYIIRRLINVSDLLNPVLIL